MSLSAQGRRAFHAQTWARIAAAVATGVLLAWSYGLNPWWGAVWVAPIPLLVAIASVRWRAAAGLGALAGAVASFSLFGYLIELSGLLDALSISAIRAVQWAIIAVVARLALSRLPAPLGVFVMPVLLAGFEVVTTLLSPHGSGGSLAYSQMDALPVIQVASLGGTAAVVFLPMLFASTVALAITQRTRVWRALIAPLLVLALALGFGAWRLSVPAAGETIGVALIASDQFEGVPDDWEEVWAVYAPAIATAAESGAEVIVLPEKLFTISADEVDLFLQEAESLAHEYGVDLVIGVDERGETASNRAYLIPHDGAAISYEKRHLIPGFESYFTPGSQNLVTQSAGLDVGIAICKDMDFPDTIRSYGADGAAVMVVPAWDFGSDAWFHSRIAILRGVENGTTVVRSARDGLLTVSDPQGQLLIEIPSEAEPQIALAQVPTGSRTPTLYAVIGESFGWACLALSLGAIAYIIARPRRKDSDPANGDGGDDTASAGRARGNILATNADDKDF